MLKHFEKHSTLCFIVFFAIASILLHYKDYNQLPTSIHTWAQSDHYALALGFVHDGMDFFHPSTFGLNHEIPPLHALDNPQGITATDFPILHYIVALLMKIFHTNAPWVFRMSNLLFSFLSLLVLFRAIAQTKNVWMALLIVSIIFFQPVYCYYQDNFLPSVFAFNNFLIGSSFLIKYYTKEKNLFFNLGVLFFTLAALARFTQIIPLLSLSGSYILVGIIKKTHSFKKTLTIAAGLSIVLAYFIYNRHLAQTYGSAFLNRPVIATSLEAFMHHTMRSLASYSRFFLPFLHAFILLTIIAVYRKHHKINPIFQPYKIYIIFLILGTTVFSCLMSYHISAHDYYSLDTWLPVLISLLIYLIYNINEALLKKDLIPLLVLTCSIGAFSVALESQLKRYRQDTTLSKPEVILLDFKKSSDFLDSHISSNDKVLIISDYGLNTPMIGWQRKVYREERETPEKIKEALKERRYDYIITDNNTFDSSLLKNYSFIKLLQTNNKVSIWQYQQ